MHRARSHVPRSSGTLSQRALACCCPPLPSLPSPLCSALPCVIRCCGDAALDRSSAHPLPSIHPSASAAGLGFSRLSTPPCHWACSWRTQARTNATTTRACQPLLPMPMHPPQPQPPRQPSRCRSTRRRSSGCDCSPRRNGANEPPPQRPNLPQPRPRSRIRQRRPLLQPPPPATANLLAPPPPPGRSRPRCEPRPQRARRLQRRQSLLLRHQHQSHQLRGLSRAHPLHAAQLQPLPLPPLRRSPSLLLLPSRATILPRPLALPPRSPRV